MVDFQSLRAKSEHWYFFSNFEAVTKICMGNFDVKMLDDIEIRF
jgi:hypothetical protein